MRTLTILFAVLLVSGGLSTAQLPNPALVGYWHNWSDNNAPYIHLDSIDNRYNVIEVAFAVPTSPTNMTMLFTPEVVSQSVFISKMQTLQSQGKKVLLSIGGAYSTIDLTTTTNKNAFINSMTSLINTFGFDGIDIDIENGNSILITGGTIAAPANTAQVNLIDAIKQIMANYRSAHSKKLLLTMAPETAYVQGGQSAFGSIWGGYLPIIHALRDSLDILQVQLYNSGTMYGIDGNIYAQGTADFIVAMTEAVIDGFTTSGGMFAGLPAGKIAVGLPACPSAAGGGFVDSATVKAAMHYVRGNGARPGSYSLKNPAGYSALRGMMTWSVNWDAVSTCAARYQYANNYGSIFGANNPPANAGSITGISTVCQGQQSVVYSVPSIANATSYIWSLPGGATGTSSTNTIAVHYGSSAVSGAITVKGTNAYGNGAPSTLTITVNPLPLVSYSVLQKTFCLYAAPVILSGGNPAGGVYSGKGVSGGMFDPKTAGVGECVITYSYTNANGCNNADSAVITVAPRPTVMFAAPAPDKFCRNSAPVTLSGGTPIGGVYSGQGVNNGIFDPSAAGAGSFMITYAFTDSNGCSGAASALLMVLPEPKVSYTSPKSNVCLNTPPVALTGGAPAGGIYAGKGVSNGIFDPAAAGEGKCMITYSYSDANGCTNADSGVITVALPTSTTLNETAVGSFTLNGKTYTQSGTYTQVLANAKGCDSAITLQLTIIPAGITELPVTAGFNLYPNPSNGTLTVETETTGSAAPELEVYSVAGVKMFAAALLSPKTEITLQVPPGVYLCHVKDRNQILATKRLIVY